MVLLLFQHTFLPMSMWRLIICPRIRCFQSGNFPSGGSSSFSPLGSCRGGPSGNLLYHSLPALLHLGISTTSGGLGVECLQPSLNISGKLCVSSSCSGSSSSVQVSGRTCQRFTHDIRFWWHHVGGRLFGSNSSQHVGSHSSAVSHPKRSWHGCFGRPGALGSTIFAFNPLAPQWCLLCRHEFSSSVYQVVVGATWVSMSKVY